MRSLQLWGRLLVGAIALIALTGVSPTFCNKYATTAVDQAKRAFLGNCGQSGPRWTEDCDAHYHW